MHFAIPILLLSLLTLTTSSPIYSPLSVGSLPPSIRKYLSNAALVDATLRRIEPLCSSLSNISMNAGALPPPSDGLELWHIGVGRGTQNYSCPMEKGESAAPTALGAVAKLYNVTCAAGYYGTDKINDLTNAVALQDKDANLALSLLQSGNHYFPDIAATTPVFNLNMGNPTTNYGITFVKKVANTTAPTEAGKSQDGSSAVPWLKLSSPDTLPAPYVIRAEDSKPNIKEVYRLNTAGGAAPKTCEGLLGQSFSKEYAAEYWMFHQP